MKQSHEEISKKGRGVKKIILIVLNVFLLSIVIFQVKKLLQKRKLDHQIVQILKTADTKYNQDSVRKQTRRIGSRYITSYYPLTDSGKQDIGIVKEKINEDIRRLSNKKNRNLEIDRLVFYISLRSIKLRDRKFYRNFKRKISLNGYLVMKGENLSYFIKTMSEFQR